MKYSPDNVFYCPTCKQLTGSWTVDDPRMWKEQCRVGDVAFQQLFVTFKGKPVPDWVLDGIPNMYHTLSEIKRLNTELLTDRKEITKLRAENLKLLNEGTEQYINLTNKLEAIQKELKEAKQLSMDWENLARLWEARNL